MTNGAGSYSVTVSTPQAFLKTLTIDVLPERPDIASGSVVGSKPNHEFRVGVGDVIAKHFTTTFLNLGTVFTKDMALSASEHVMAFATTRQVYATWSSSGGFRSDMDTVTINLNSSIGNITPTTNDVFINAGVGTTDPYTIAHELGHALMWRSWGLYAAIIQPADYLFGVNPPYPALSCGNVSWSRFSCEFEKVAFAEGFADANGAMWMWERGANPVDDCTSNAPRIPREGGLDMENPGSCFPEETYDHNKPICNARAMWDIMDEPPGDSDGSTNRDLNDMVSVFKHYPTGVCGIYINHCRNEGDPYSGCGSSNGNNWRDFRANWVDLFGSSQDSLMNTIEDGNGLDQTTP